MLRFIMQNHRMVKIGTTNAQRKLFFNLKKEKARLAGMGIEATSAELATRLSVREKDVMEMEGRLGAEVALDAPFNESESPRVDFVTADGMLPDEALADAERACALEEFKQKLTPYQQTVFQRRMLDNEVLEDVGASLGVSRQAVQQLESRLTDRLRKFCKGRKLENLL